MQFRRTAHSTYRLQYHVVWVCKYRRRILNPGLQKFLRRVLPKLLRSMPGVEIEMIGVEWVFVLLKCHYMATLIFISSLSYLANRGCPHLFPMLQNCDTFSNSIHFLSGFQTTKNYHQPLIERKQHYLNLVHLLEQQMVTCSNCLILRP